MARERTSLPLESGEEIEAALAQPWYRTRFAPRMEQRFERDTSAARSSQIAFMLLFIAAMGLFVLLPDAQVSHAQLVRGLIFRVGLATPLLLFGAWLLRRNLPVWVQGAAALIPLVVAIACDCGLSLRSSGQTADRYFTGIGMGIFFNNLIMPLRLKHAILATLLTLIVYDAFLCGVFGPCPILEGPQVAMNMSLFAALSLVFRWRNEIAYRRSFLLSVRDRLHEQQLAWANRQLTQLSYTDALTGMPNRRYFDEMLDKAWSAAKDSGEPLALMMIDVDHFKDFNDAFGHAAGDRCLQRIAHALQFSVRVDVDTVARYGGEEFVAILPAASLESAVQIGERVRLAITAVETPALPTEEKRVTASLGVAVSYDARQIVPADLLGVADDALYAAKARGRDCIVAKQTPAHGVAAQPSLATGLVG